MAIRRVKSAGRSKPEAQAARCRPASPTPVDVRPRAGHRRAPVASATEIVAWACRSLPLPSNELCRRQSRRSPRRGTVQRRRRPSRLTRPDPRSVPSRPRTGGPVRGRPPDRPTGRGEAGTRRREPPKPGGLRRALGRWQHPPRNAAANRSRSGSPVVPFHLGCSFGPDRRGMSPSGTELATLGEPQCVGYRSAVCPALVDGGLPAPN